MIALVDALELMYYSVVRFMMISPTHDLLDVKV